ncbi:carboxypeptidase regulatory-like domain-containing protein [Acidobacteria bacterium AB60]|nr:carboxypeptidase regulatory-like domain-containing protein [Acidobacteria bacterium AB60]
MKRTSLCVPRSVVAAACLLAGVFAHAAAVTGTVNNKTTGKPSAGDSVVLVDVGAGMSEAATATTDSSGHYSMQAPGMGPYLVRVNHQGATYFIAAPAGNVPGDVTVYDVAAKVEGVSIDADMLLVEGASGSLRVQERYLIRNSSLPPKAQYSDKTFEIVLPPDAELDGASATRPGGLGTNTRLVPLGSKGHYTFNIPIQPDQGEKETMFEVQYHMPYKGKYSFSHSEPMPADSLVVYVPKGMSFTAGSGADFGPSQEDPRVQTYIHKNVKPGQTVAFTVSGEGSMPRDQQPQQRPTMGAAGAMGMGDQAGSAATPGGGIGQPINTPDPLSRYKWWILGILALLLAGGAVFMLRKQTPALAGFPGGAKADGFDADAFAAAPVARVQTQPAAPAPAYAPSAQAAPRGSSAPGANANATLMSILKDELFAIESERLAGTLSQAEYTEVKAGLEAVLKRALKRQ